MRTAAGGRALSCGGPEGAGGRLSARVGAGLRLLSPAWSGGGAVSVGFTKLLRAEASPVATAAAAASGPSVEASGALCLYRTFETQAPQP